MANVEAVLRTLINQVNKQAALISALEDKLRHQPAALSPTQLIDSIPGRRVFFTGIQTQTFTTSQNKVAGAGMTIQFSQDGPFIMTHYPLLMWKPTSPSGATLLNQWQPIMTGNLPTQQTNLAAGTGTFVLDLVWLSYSMIDSGSGRQLQDANGNVPPGLLSLPGQLMPLPVPTLIAPGDTLTLIPFYELIQFANANGGTATTGGTLYWMQPGYKVVNQ